MEQRRPKQNFAYFRINDRISVLRILSAISV